MLLLNIWKLKLLNIVVFVVFKYRCAITTGTVTVKQAGPLLTATLKAMEEVWTVDRLIMASS